MLGLDIHRAYRAQELAFAHFIGTLLYTVSFCCAPPMPADAVNVT